MGLWKMVKVSSPWREITFGAGALHHVEYISFFTQNAAHLSKMWLHWAVPETNWYARQTGAVPGSQQPELSRVSQLTAQVVGSFVHDPL